MVIELSGVQFGMKSDARDLKTSLIWSHKYDFRQKFYDTKFRIQNSVSTNILSIK